MTQIPDFVVEFFLLGRTSRDAIERYTQDGGIVSDVWLAFAKDPNKPRRVLVAPTNGTSAINLAYALNYTITAFRKNLRRPEKPGVSPLESFVAVTLYLDELLSIILPMSNWWHDKKLSALHWKTTFRRRTLDDMLFFAIRKKLGPESSDDVSELPESVDLVIDHRVIQAASLAALIGVFWAAEHNPSFLNGLEKVDPRTAAGEELFVEWIQSRAENIASAAREGLAKPFLDELLTLPPDITRFSRLQTGDHQEPPVLVQRVFLDRQASLSDTEAISTIKADAAINVFDISCHDITWAIIDSGIATTHPAFEDNGGDDSLFGTTPGQDHRPSRVKATYDFTRIERIRNFDLTLDPEGSLERRQTIEALAEELANLPGRIPPPNFRQDAIRLLGSIARQLEQRIPQDWGVIEPLIRWGDQDNGANLVSDHGTHVAGILGGNWLKKPEQAGHPGVILHGVCRDINLYDLRVIHPASRKSTEFAILAALEFVQFINSREAGAASVIHGVNISLSIPHDVRNYGCGSTPICVACDQAVNSGVVVVAAAGNRGWNEQDGGFGNFVFCSITDPGNAREVITVGSTHRLKPHTYGISYFSSRGPTGDGRIKPDLVAPGEQIRGPIRGGADDQLDGTSMAAPFVSGAAALLMARNRELMGNPRRVKEILCNSATDLGRERYFQGHGLLDVLRAIQSV